MPTRKQLNNLIQKISPQRGDFLVVRDYETLQRVMQIDGPRHGIHPVPIIVAPDGIESVNAATLRAYLRAAEESEPKIILPPGTRLT